MNNFFRGVDLTVGFALGGIVGAAIALLLAPESGQKTRKQIRARAKKLKNRGKELEHETIRQAHKIVDESQKRVSDAQDRAGSALEEQKARMGEAIDTGKQGVLQQEGQLLSLLVSAGSSFEAWDRGV